MPLSSGGSAVAVPASAMPAIAGTAKAVANVRKTLVIVIRNLKVVSARSTLAGHAIPGCGHHVAESKCSHAAVAVSGYPVGMFASSTARLSVSRSTTSAAFIGWVSTPDSFAMSIMNFTLSSESPPSSVQNGYFWMSANSSLSDSSRGRFFDVFVDRGLEQGEVALQCPHRAQRGGAVPGGEFAVLVRANPLGRPELP